MHPGDCIVQITKRSNQDGEKASSALREARRGYGLLLLGTHDLYIRLVWTGMN